MKKNDKIKYGFLTVCLIALVGCSSFGAYNPATGRNEFIAISTPAEVEMGQDVHQTLTQQYEFSSDLQKVERVKRVGNAVARYSHRQDYSYNFYVVKKEDLNAFTTPGGNIYVHTGLLDKFTTDDQLAFVLAHEIGHCAARHTIKKFQSALGYNLIGGLVLSQVADESAQKIASLSANAVMSLVFSAYSRKDEFEADRLGLEYMQKAGYDAQGAVESFEILKEEHGGAKTPIFLRSHPYIEDRIKAINQARSRTY